MHRPGPTSPADWHGDGRRSALVPRDSGTGLGRTRRSRRTRGLKDAAGQSFQGHKFTQMFQSILRCPGTIQIQFDPQIAGAAKGLGLPLLYMSLSLLLSHLYAITQTTERRGVPYSTVKHGSPNRNQKQKTGRGLDRRRMVAHRHTKDSPSVALKRDSATEMSND